MDEREFLARADLRPDRLRIWLETGSLAPSFREGVWHYCEIDLARARLIRDLQDDLGINDEGIAVVLDLVDQVGGLRHVLQAVLRALRAQPDAIRRQIADDCAARSRT
ncbi:MerR family transcriptional regulator [Methylobacterium pseudosasicola]|uniref:Chaperone modulatory protein CbpM n=1 Tax=Methylobacterium pseudosasicola TaxID=582667 RepID=A0A1I4R421_9HYPH|nr:MerR family transcriptional regulator [Methylobacterium pseudosasicola]SFM47048.1 chaperone modulatory protein CbpM [Methylobacterium pseudosasicola]